MKGYFISVEGGDGSGKSTQMQRIEAYLTEMGQEVLLTREPGRYADGRKNPRDDS